MSIKKLDIIRQLIPPLSHEFHKGQAGRICVVGGSEEFTGAPYFCAYSALKLGADLSYVICHQSASSAIKSYSPDLMVFPYMRSFDDIYDDNNSSKSEKEIMEKINTLHLSRFHVIVVGPGLSKDVTMLECAKEIILRAKMNNLPIVIDADGITLIQDQPELIKNYTQAVLTPNINEFKKICEKMDINLNNNDDKESAIKKLGLALGGVTIVQKGQNDLISNGDKVFIVDNNGGLKRCGGQGDVLSGLIATFLSWGSSYKRKLWEHDNSISSSDIPMLASYAGCTIVRECSRTAFEKFRRSTQTSDILEEIGSSYCKFFFNR